MTKKKKARNNNRKNKQKKTTISSLQFSPARNLREKSLSMQLLTAAFEATTLDDGAGRSLEAETGVASPSRKFCFHGSSPELFLDDNEYNKVFIRCLENGVENSLFKMTDEQKLFVYDRRFTQYIFSLCTSIYLERGFSPRLSKMLLLGIFFRNGIDNERFYKYMRDLSTERGAINCMAKETPCNCMNPAKTKAKGMAKVGRCNGCSLEFPKKHMFLCACGISTYCSKDCQVKDWPVHKETCPMVVAAYPPYACKCCQICSNCNF